MSRSLVFAATYNEADTIKDLIAQIHHYAPHVDILIVDDSSPDGTGELLQHLQAVNKQLHVIHRPRKLGIGTAHLLCMKYALSRNYDFLITMDADFSHHPKYIPQVIDALKSYDFVIGSRFVEGGRCEYPLSRLIISKTANHLGRFLLKLSQKELTTSFRGFSNELLRKMMVDEFRSDGYSFFLESTVRINSITDQICEIPIHFNDRRFGETKISRIEIFKGFRKLLRMWLFPSRQKKCAEEQTPETTQIEYQQCPVCENSHFQKLYEATNTGLSENNFSCTNTYHQSHGRIVRCLVCNLIFTNPQPQKSILNSLYTQIEDETYVENIEARFKTFKHNWKKVAPFAPQHGSLLDVGCYCGAWLKVANNMGYAAQGVEPSTWAASYAREHFGVDVFRGTLEEFAEKGERFDIVTSWDVLEHVSNPKEELHLLNNCIEMGGVLAFSTLDIQNWFARLLGERWPWMMDMHLYYFDEKGLERLLCDSGFRVVSIQPYCHIITLDYLLRKLDVLGMPGAKMFRHAVSSTILRHVCVPFRFGDIKLYCCVKINDVAFKA